jgi:hypothetical protein
MTGADPALFTELGGRGDVVAVGDGRLGPA